MREVRGEATEARSPLLPSGGWAEAFTTEGLTAEKRLFSEVRRSHLGLELDYYERSFDHYGYVADKPVHR